MHGMSCCDLVLGVQTFEGFYNVFLTSKALLSSIRYDAGGGCADFVFLEITVEKLECCSGIKRFKSYVSFFRYSSNFPFSVTFFFAASNKTALARRAYSKSSSY